MSRKPGFVLLLVLAHAALALAATSANTLGWRAPPWACSPAPLRRNFLCPTPADGDKQRCNAISCLPDAGCATEDCNAVEGNIAADGIVALDAWMQRGTTCVKHSWSLADCCRLCQFTESCNAWSYCNNPAGCGVGCEAPKHNFQYDPQLNLWQLNPQDYPARLNPEHRCQANGAWPYQTCTLKVVSGEIDAKNPPLLEGAASNGWVSGSVARVVSKAPVPAEPSSSVDPAEQAILDGFYDEGGFENSGILLQEQPATMEQGVADSTATETLVVEPPQQERPKHQKRQQEQPAAAKQQAEATPAAEQAAGSASGMQALQLDSSVAELIGQAAEAQLPSVSPELPADEPAQQQPPAAATVPAAEAGSAAAPSAALEPAKSANADSTAAAAAAAAQKDREEASVPRVLAPAKIHVSEAQIKVLSATPSTTSSVAASNTTGSKAAEPSQNAAFGSGDARSWRVMAATLALGLLWQAAML